MGAALSNVLVLRIGPLAAARGPILKTRTFERAAPTAADPREKLLSDPWRRRGSEAQKTLRVLIT